MVFKPYVRHPNKKNPKWGGSRPGQKNGSENIRAVARDVVETVQKGEKVVMSKILRRHGYSESTAASPVQVTSRPAYKEEIRTYTEQLEQHRQNVLTAMMNKDLDTEQYRTLSDAQTKLTHDVQLLSGGKTENVGLEEDKKTLKAIVAAIQLEE